MRDVADFYDKVYEYLYKGEDVEVFKEISLFNMTGCRCCHQLINDEELDNDGMCKECSEEYVTTV